jgi:hypothetical protein
VNLIPYGVVVGDPEHFVGVLAYLVGDLVDHVGVHVHLGFPC